MKFNNRKNKVNTAQVDVTDSSKSFNESTNNAIDRVNNKKKKSDSKKLKNKMAEKLDMYDMIIANMIAGESLILPDKKLASDEIQIGFSNISSESQVTKYFLIRSLPDFVEMNLFDYIRYRCSASGVKINFYTYCEPYKIDWDSPEMRNKLSIWRRYSDEHSGPIDVFDYRNQRSSDMARKRIIMSTKYLNDAELNQKRSLTRAAFMISISANRDNISILNMINSIKEFKSICSSNDIKIRELKINLIDWMQVLSPFSLRKIKGVSDRVSYRIMTDDVLANFNSCKQGRVGNNGVPLGMDVKNGETVVWKFKEDPDASENWLICAGAGGGKSYWIKSLITYLLADGFVVTVLDYEGDEYTNLASYIYDGNPNDVRVISMGKGSTLYFDPCEIPKLTGDDDVDNELKSTAFGYIDAIFKIIVGGVDGNITLWEEKVISTAIQRVYDSAGVTDDKSTWYRSSGLRLSMIYDELKDMEECKELIDESSDNVKYKALVKVVNACSVYFDEGESKYGTFSSPISVESLYEAKFIVFSFGMRGAGDSTIDKDILALKQLSIANMGIQITNHCKYVKHCFNVKVWEEYQRWGQAKGSSEIITNAMTGGRKRGEVNFIITNDLAEIVSNENAISKKIRGNIQNFVIGNIKDKDIRERFCNIFDLQNCRGVLKKIASAHTETNKGRTDAENRTDSKYKHSFCLILDNGKKAVVKVKLPKSLAQSDLFKTGVVIDKLGYDDKNR